MSSKSQEFRASNPADFKLDRWHYYSHALMHEQGWQFYVYCIIVPAIIIAVLGYFFVCAWVLMILVLLLVWRHDAANLKHFSEGLVCPGKVISLSPDLVAVSTNLSYVADKSFPVIHVILCRFQSWSGEPVRMGERVAVVTSYDLGEYDDEHEAVEGKFKGLMNRDPVRSATRDPQVISRTLASLDEDDWESLEHGLRQVPTPSQPGTYPYEMPAP